MSSPSFPCCTDPFPTAVGPFKQNVEDADQARHLRGVIEAAMPAIGKRRATPGLFKFAVVVLGSFGIA
jgi:hypothetical protein